MVKYEEVYLHAYSDGWPAKNQPVPPPLEVLPLRPHSLQGGRTPHEDYSEIEPCSSHLELKMSWAGTVY